MCLPPAHLLILQFWPEPKFISFYKRADIKSENNIFVIKYNREPYSKMASYTIDDKHWQSNNSMQKKTLIKNGGSFFELNIHKIKNKIGEVGF